MPFIYSTSCNICHKRYYTYNDACYFDDIADIIKASIDKDNKWEYKGDKYWCENCKLNKLEENNNNIQWNKHDIPREYELLICKLTPAATARLNILLSLKGDSLYKILYRGEHDLFYEQGASTRYGIHKDDIEKWSYFL